MGPFPKGLIILPQCDAPHVLTLIDLKQLKFPKLGNTHKMELSPVA